MSEGLLKLCGVAMVCAMLLTLLKKWGAELAVLLKLAGGIVLGGLCFGMLSPVINYLGELCRETAMESLIPSVALLLRVLCVATVTHVTSSVCRDCGEATLAYYAELGGKLEILILCLPVMRDLVDSVLTLTELTL